ncbi:MAG: Hpt domain-containing protein [Gammaproteobacteria bacterium]
MTEDTVEYNSLKWVKKELDLILTEAQTSLSAYIEDPEGESARLNECIEHLHMVQGTLQMVELFGAAQLSEEMEHLAQALVAGEIDQKDDAYDVLMSAMLQLPDYLESLLAGSKDVPMVLLPLLNDLRAARNASLLSENVLFFPNIDLTDDSEIAGDVAKGQLLSVAKKLRPHYQVGLLGWFKGQKVRASLKRILAVLTELEKNSSSASVRRLWSISAATIEGLANEGLNSSLSIKMLIGQVDRSIKQLIDVGEEAFAKTVSSDLLKNLLYYVARVNKDSERVKTIKDTYRLNELLPGDKELEEARSGLGGLNTELLQTVSQGIREDLIEVKDILEIYAHSDVRDMERLKVLPELLSKIADTLAMLGLGEPRENVLSQKEKIKEIVQGAFEPSEDSIMDIASVLLTVEAQLNSFIANRSASLNKDSKPDADSGMPEGEYREVLTAVVREALQDFSDARQAILSYLEDHSNKQLLKVVLTRLDQVNGAMFMLPFKHLDKQIDALRSYIIKVLLNAGETPDAQTQDYIADVVTGIEYYLESVIEGEPKSLSSSENAADKLLEISSAYEDVTEMEIDAIPDESESVEAKSTGSGISAVASPVPVSDQEFRILGDDADPEILEIFIEEALEELASINEQLPRWRDNHEDEEALTTIRRSFHTLKGSGRLISADLIGEFSWAFENMLNRVIDKSRPPDKDVFDALNEALGILPQLIEQLTGNREPVDDVYELMARADALGKWDKTDKAKSSVKTKPAQAKQASDVVPSETEASLPLEPELDVDFQSADEALLAGASADLDDLDPAIFDAAVEQLSADLQATDEGPIETELSDDFDIDLTTDFESLQMAAGDTDEDVNDLGVELDVTEINESDSGLSFEVSGQAETDLTREMEATDLSFAEDGPAIHVDPVLFEIYKGESEAHLEKMRELLDQHFTGEQHLLAGQELIRALHTLYGSARTAEVDAIAEISGATEKFVRLHSDLGIERITDEGIELIVDVHRVVTSMLESMSDPEIRLRPDKELLSRIQAANSNLSAQMPAQQQDTSLDFADSFEAESISDVEQPAMIEPVSAVVPSATPADGETLVAYGDVDDELVDIFLEEAEELIDGCENSLQKWSSNNADIDSVRELQRQLHTLKGGARMADLSTIGDLTHALESLIIAVNDKRVSFKKDMGYVLHESMDKLSDMLAKVKTREPLYTADRLINLLDALRRGEAVDIKKSEEELIAAQADETDLASSNEMEEEISLLDFSEELYPDGDDDSNLVEEELGEIDILDLDSFAEAAISESGLEIDAEAHQIVVDEPVAKPPVEHMDVVSAAEPLQAAIAEEQPVKSNIAQEQVRVRSDLLNELVNHAGEVSVYHARMNQQITNFSFNLSEMDQTVTRLREQLRKLSIETEAQILSRYEKESDQYGEDFDPLEMDRFSTMQQISRSLQETVSDMESIRDILNEQVRDSETLLLQESRVSTDLQEGLMRTRMVHFGGLASRLRRIVRQTARELDKEVELEISGESSEVDRTVLDKIIAPMEHMLRNAVSHGVETPDLRVRAGKPEQGIIKISVDREGGDVVIKVEDDGRGIDVNAVRKKAVAQGLVDRGSALGDHEVLQFIMKAGFSTAETVTQISGRGVGMDVVDSEIKQLGGVLEIATVEGRGTTFTIRLPLTLAINHALMVSAGEEMYAIPLNAIEGVVRLSGPELQMFYNSESSKYEFAGVQYELRHLGRLLTGYQPDYSGMGQLYPVLLAHVGDQFVALHVDDLLGRREIVVKPVGPQIGHVRAISGATILGDGRVVLILEMNSLILGDAFIQVGAEEVVPAEQVVPEIVTKHEPIVMVVDDSITIRKVTERMLGRHNMKVVTAKDGVDAVSQLQDFKPDVMLLDIEMPRMDGYEVATHVRNDERLKDLPIIMITSRSGAKHKDKAMEIGVNKYLGKPYQEDELMANIHELIG